MRNIITSAMAASAMMMLASPAQAAVVIGGFTLDTGNFGGPLGVHGAGGNQSGSSVNGIVNGVSLLDGGGVTFSTSTGSLNLNGGGLANINGDPLIEDLGVLFAKGWDNVTFAFQGASTFSLLVNGTALFESPGCDICTTGGNNSQFTLSGTGITSLAFTFDPGVDRARQFRVEGVSTTPAIPEPATWAMMVVGIGFVGSMMRRRATKVQFA